MIDAPALSWAISYGRSRLRSGIVTDGVIVRWGGTTSSSRGIDSRNKLVGDAIVDDPPDSELTTEPDDERDPSTDADNEHREEPSTGVNNPVRRRFAELSRVSDEVEFG